MSQFVEVILIWNTCTEELTLINQTYIKLYTIARVFTEQTAIKKRNNCDFIMSET